VVGINPPFRIEFEHRNSTMGYIGVVNGNAAVIDVSGLGKDGQLLTYNWATILLDDMGFFLKLMNKKGW